MCVCVCLMVHSAASEDPSHTYIHTYIQYLSMRVHSRLGGPVPHNQPFTVAPTPLHRPVIQDAKTAKLAAKIPAAQPKEDFLAATVAKFPGDIFSGSQRAGYDLNNVSRRDVSLNETDRHRNNNSRQDGPTSRYEKDPVHNNRPASAFGANTHIPGSPKKTKTGHPDNASRPASALGLMRTNEAHVNSFHRNSFSSMNTSHQGSFATATSTWYTNTGSDSRKPSIHSYFGQEQKSVEKVQAVEHHHLNMIRSKIYEQAANVRKVCMHVCVCVCVLCGFRSVCMYVCVQSVYVCRE
jgi:hypothetical protein